MTPKYFVLNGTRAYTTDKCPELIYFEGEVRLKGYNSIIKVVSTKELDLPHQFTTSLDPKNIPVYKSNLQKCIRRQLTDNAIRTGYAMMSANTPDFLRRLPIIMIEDVLPHPSIIPLVWWMMATTKGYQLSDFEVSWILGIIYMVCTIPLYQVKNEFCIIEGPIPRWNRFIQGKRDMLWALEFRKAYGGMSCDTNMINYLQQEWIKRFAAVDNKLWKYLNMIVVEPIDIETIGECDKSDVILEAIDHHCFSWILKKLHKCFPHYSEYEIKGAIWLYRSRVNKRELCLGSQPLKYAEELDCIYDEIKDQLEGLCRWIFDKII